MVNGAYLFFNDDAFLSYYNDAFNLMMFLFFNDAFYFI